MKNKFGLLSRMYGLFIWKSPPCCIIHGYVSLDTLAVFVPHPHCLHLNVNQGQGETPRDAAKLE